MGREPARSGPCGSGEFLPGSEGSLIREFFEANRAETRYVFCPFIQKRAFESVVPDDESDTIIVTTWREPEIRSGVSDPRIFETARDHDYTLKIHPSLHLKVYSWALEDAIVGSANLTAAGLGLSDTPNEEYLQLTKSLSPERQIQLYRIVESAPIVSQGDFDRAIEIWRDRSPPEKDHIEFGQKKEKPKFETSNLPLTKDPSKLVGALRNWDRDAWRTHDDETRRCILHDIAIFELEEYAESNEATIREALQRRFMAHPFIKAISREMDPCIYFGEMKAWVQERCTDVPTPSRRSLTDNVQVLYSWFPELLPDRFELDVPGHHSERLCKKD